jgi:hypothetical protein
MINVLKSTLRPLYMYNTLDSQLQSTKEAIMEQRTQIISVELADGKNIHVEALALGGEQDVGFGSLSFEGVADAIEGIVHAISDALEKVKPQKATVEFGIELATESGELTALLVKGHGTASITIALEWSAKEQA